MKNYLNRQSTNHLHSSLWLNVSLRNYDRELLHEEYTKLFCNFHVYLCRIIIIKAMFCGSFCLFSRFHSYKLIRNIKNDYKEKNRCRFKYSTLRSYICTRDHNYAITRAVSLREEERKKILFSYLSSLYENTRISGNHKNYGNVSHTATFTFTKT